MDLDLKISPWIVCGRRFSENCKAANVAAELLKLSGLLTTKAGSSCCVLLLCEQYKALMSTMKAGNSCCVPELAFEEAANSCCVPEPLRAF